MRAACEACAKPQPADWRPGDLCVHCGQPVREQVRCYWCTHWIPAGNFCRHCGAEGIAPAQYAPARMLKQYGSDVFSIPKLLREMDPARIETFRAIYDRHLGIAMRHIEDLRSLEPELFHKHWSAKLEEALIPQLPWPEDKLEQYSAAQSIGRNSPFATTSMLATLVELRKGDFSILQKHGPYWVSSGGPDDLRLEVALQLANWRVAGNTYLESLRYAVLDALRAAEDKTPLVRLSLVYLGDRETTTPEDSITSSDPEVAFFGALLLGNEPILRQGLESQNPLQRMVAANKLIDLGKLDGLGEYFERHCDADQQLTLIQRIQLEKRPVPSLHAALFDAIRRHPKTKLARMAASAICQGCSHAEAMRLASTFDWEILHSLSLAKLEPETFREIGELLVGQGMVNNEQYAWLCFAASGRMPQDFVERVWSVADRPEIQVHLLAFAEKQLDDLPGIPRGTSMERVLIRAAFGDHAPEVIGAAWVGLHRINYHRDFGSISPFPYSKEAIEEFWPFEEFERNLKRLQSNAGALEKTFVADELGRFLRSRDR